MENRAGVSRTATDDANRRGPGRGWLVVLIASLVFLVNIVSPPRLMDDVDAVQAQIARNMLTSKDWVTARLDGVAYLEKAPLIYWMMAVSYKVFGVHDWAARLPLAMSALALCWITYSFGRWAFGEEAGLYAGVILATSAGLFLFTRILIPDATLTATITGAIWAWLSLLEPDGRLPLRWSVMLGACLGTGLLLKGLIAVVFPVLAGIVYMALTRQLLSLKSWRRLTLGTAIVIALAIAVPWHVLATLHNPPYFAFSMQSEPGKYHGFFWFYFFNEHLLRFLNLRYPRDYNTVPRLWFWLLNVVWTFPWSVYLFALPRFSFSPVSRGERTRLMALCWIGVVMLFFTFSTTQEYYSMPIYPALALLIGSGISAAGRRVRTATGVLLMISTMLCVALIVLIALVWRLPAVGNISTALTQHPELYTLSMGHMRDLTLSAFAYLRLPLAIAAFAFGMTAIGLVGSKGKVKKVVLIVAVGMVIFVQAARIALVRFDSYLGSYPLAQSVEQSPPGQLIEANSYYAFSSVFFYTGRTALLLNGRNNNLEYGSYAPGAPRVFIDDREFVSIWTGAGRCYLLAYGTELPHLGQLVGQSHLRVVSENAGNYLLTNYAIP